ncbi:hypothetical protein EJB05_19162, partial [Eragrostis curvula]
MESTSRERKDEGGEGTPSSADQAEDKESRDAGNDEDDEQGTRQPYKCTFCRRGFPTAQALGGHMNVHRKHRGRSGAPSIAGAAAVQGRSHEHQYSSLVTFAQTTHPASETTPSMASGEEGSMSFHAAGERVTEPKELRLFCAAQGARDVHEDRNRSKDDHGQGEELDLELRLGGGADVNVRDQQTTEDQTPLTCITMHHYKAANKLILINASCSHSEHLRSTDRATELDIQKLHKCGMSLMMARQDFQMKMKQLCLVVAVAVKRPYKLNTTNLSVD